MTPEPNPDEVYRDLPPELLAVLRDPRVVLPGEEEVYGKVSRWVDLDNPNLNSPTISADTPPMRRVNKVDASRWVG